MRKQVAWRVLYRTVAPDDKFLSPAYGRQTVTISLHHNAGLPFEEYFGDIEPIFLPYRSETGGSLSLEGVTPPRTAHTH